MLRKERHVSTADTEIKELNLCILVKAQQRRNDSNWASAMANGETLPKQSEVFVSLVQTTIILQCFK